ncbi:MAG TPA: hypothetical protein VNO33_15225 [Kofleriaceae bacterium]|nr:hypothetical protein [Kofleriaceae bacterium]
MTPRFLLLLAALVAFTVYTLAVGAGHGYLGFLTLAWREPWAMQMLLDLLIALVLFLTWVVRDARSRGLPFWPFAAATLLLGSVGALSYMVARELKRPQAG